MLEKDYITNISNEFVNWFWNFGDNIYLAVFKQDTTWGMIRAFSGAMNGDWSHFALWPSYLDLQAIISTAPLATLT